MAGGFPGDATVVVSVPDLPWMLFLGRDADGAVCWILAECVMGDANGYELALAEHPSTDALVSAMVRYCGRPIAETLVDELALRAPLALGRS